MIPAAGASIVAVDMKTGKPFGETMSGVGREGGFDHVESYLETKSVWIRTDA